MESPKGLTIQRNAGLRRATGDVVWFLDDDVSFDSDFAGKINYAADPSTPLNEEDRKWLDELLKQQKLR